MSIDPNNGAGKSPEHLDSIDTSTTSPALELKHCRSCYTQIPKLANKCTACKSAQNWERYLGFSGTVLGLLVALVSVLTFALPIWKQSFYVPSPRFYGAYVRGDTGFQITISNFGDAPMTFEQLMLHVGDKSGPNFVLDSDIKGRDRLIESNKTILVTPEFEKQEDQRKIDIAGKLVGYTANKVNCYIRIQADTPSGGPKFYFIRPDAVSCQEIMLSLRVQGVQFGSTPSPAQP